MRPSPILPALALAVWPLLPVCPPALAQDVVARQDLLIHDVPLQDALDLIAEAYDLNIASGQLPEIRVSLRLKRATADEALQALAAATGLRVLREGKVVGLEQGLSSEQTTSPTVAMPPNQAPSADVRRIVRGPFTGRELQRLLPALERTGVEVEEFDGAVVVEGNGEAVSAAVNLLTSLRLPAGPEVRARVFHLGTVGGPAAQEAVQALLGSGEEVAVSYAAEEHALVVRAPGNQLQEVALLLAELERHRPQVEIEARLVEIGGGTLQRLGANWSLRFGAAGGVMPSTWPLRDLNDSLPFVPSPADVGDAGPDFTFSQLDASQLSVLLELLGQEDDYKVLARPRVTALHNRSATVRIVETLRIPTFTNNQAFATTTVTGIEEIEVGTRLEVLPRVGTSGEVYLRVTPQVSEVTGFSPEGLPTVAERSTTTEVVLRSGESLVIGGLVREQERETVTRVPLLGDLPLLGRLFRHTSSEVKRTELLIFLTPRRLPSAAERKKLRRIDDQWLPRRLAERLETARAQLAEPSARRRRGALVLFEELDAELSERALDESPRWRQVAASDEDLGVRAAALELLLRRRPQQALRRLLDEEGTRDLVAVALGGELAPHLRAVLASALAGSPGGTQALRRALLEARDQGDVRRQARLLEAVVGAAPAESGDLVLEYLNAPERRLRLAALDAAIVRRDPGAAEAVERLVRTPDLELEAWGLTALALGAGGPRGIAMADQIAKSPNRAWPRPTPLGVRRLARDARRLAPEPPLRWAHADEDDPWLQGDRQSVAHGRAALELLAERAPDYLHLVRAAFRVVEFAGRREQLFVEQRSLRLPATPAEYPAARLAHRLARHAYTTFQARVRSLPPRGIRALAAGVRAEVEVLERLSGSRCPDHRADVTVLQVLRSSSGEER